MKFGTCAQTCGILSPPSRFVHLLGIPATSLSMFTRICQESSICFQLHHLLCRVPKGEVYERQKTKAVEPLCLKRYLPTVLLFNSTKTPIKYQVG